MITGVQDIYYNVSNMARAVEFYSQVLGMKILDTNEWWSSLECQGLRIGLHGTGGEDVPTVPSDNHGPHAGETLTLRTSDADHALKVLTEAGVKILGFHKQPWGKMIVLEDSEGNILKVMEPAQNP